MARRCCLLHLINQICFLKTLLGTLILKLPRLCILTTELFNMCLKESCFPDCWNVLSMVLVFKNAGERSNAKNYPVVRLLVFFLWLVKSLKNL